MSLQNQPQIKIEGQKNYGWVKWVFGAGVIATVVGYVVLTRDQDPPPDIEQFSLVEYAVEQVYDIGESVQDIEEESLELVEEGQDTLTELIATPILTGLQAAEKFKPLYEGLIRLTIAILDLDVQTYQAAWNIANAAIWNHKCIQGNGKAYQWYVDIWHKGPSDGFYIILAAPEAFANPAGVFAQTAPYGSTGGSLTDMFDLRKDTEHQLSIAKARREEGIGAMKGMQGQVEFAFKDNMDKGLDTDIAFSKSVNDVLAGIPGFD